MCRFLAIKNTGSNYLQKDLEDFVSMCRESRTIEGDLQGDGWGVAWKNSRGEWQTYHSLNPIWDELDHLLQISGYAKELVVHARSASFDDYKDDISVNQPYLSKDKNRVFAFNGVVYKVKLKRRLEGKIGAQKIFSLVNQEVEREYSLEKEVNPLSSSFNLIKDNSESIKGFNCVLLNNNNLSVVSDYSVEGEYFKLYKTDLNGKIIVCSQQIGNYPWQLIPKRQIIDL
jgi:predicted glutamine amidotransferase